MNTDRLSEYFEKLWDQSPDTFPSFEKTYPVPIKKEKENLFSAYMEKFKTFQEEVKKGKSTTDTGKFFNAMGKFMQEVYGYSDKSLSIILHEDMIKVSKEFFIQSRSFDPQLKSEEIYQAMRNVWIMNGLQLLMGLKPELTPSIFGYSMIYPYSDNIIDDPAISHHEKQSFNERLEKRLLGVSEMSDNQREIKISNLVTMIESQYPRDRFPDVYDSLLAIHHAQTRSLLLTRKDLMLSDKDVPSISIDKGGSSVLADGFLVSGQLPPDVQRFFYGFGVWLQLFDDIQDIPEDQRTGTRTLFSMPDKPERRIQFTNKTVHFGRSVINDIKYCPSDIYADFSEVIIQSIEAMLVQSVGLNDHYYRPFYYEKMENFSPLGFNWLKEARKKGSPGRFKMIIQWLESNR